MTGLNAEPTMITEVSAPMGKWEKIRYLTSRVVNILKSDLKFGLCLVGKMITQIMAILFSLYMLLWITTFVD